jgi:ethanolamine utilization protein EutN
MILGRVVGNVWATRKDARLSHTKLLLVRAYGAYRPSHSTEQIVAVDSTLDAGVGDDVVVCFGSPARWHLGGVNYPVDAAVMAVVDRCNFSREAFSDEARRPVKLAGDMEPREVDWT